MKLRPLADRVIVKRLEQETKTASGIVIPDAAASAFTCVFDAPWRRSGTQLNIPNMVWIPGSRLQRVPE